MAEGGGSLSSVSGFLRESALWVDAFPDLWLGDGIASGITLLAGGVDMVGSVLDGNISKVGRDLSQSLAETAAVALPFAEYAGLAKYVGVDLDVRTVARNWAGETYDNLTGNFNEAASGETPEVEEPELEASAAPATPRVAAPKP